MGAHKPPAELEPIRALAAEGCDGAQISERLAVPRQRLYQLSRRYGITIARSKTKGHNERAARAEQMAAMYRQGITLADIGVKFKLTRERVRQVLAKMGLDHSSGGQHVVSAIKRASKDAAKRRRIEHMYGVSYELWQELAANGTTRRYQYHRRNSRNRAIKFTLTFAEWYAVWHTSGKLHLCGKGKGSYCMSRLQDSGGYELGNVHIQPIVDNSRDAVEVWRGKTKEYPGVFLLYPGRDRAWMAKVGKVRLGYFSTVEEGAAARVAYCEANQIPLDGPRVGHGRGWTYVKRLKTRPYLVQVAGTKGTYHATEDEARNEYLRRCAEVLSGSSG